MISCIHYILVLARVETTLREARRASNLSQAELAQAAGVSRQAYAAIERGFATPATDVALRLARALDTAVESLFRLSEQEVRAVEAEWVTPGVPLPERAVSAPASGRVDLHQVGQRWLARPLQGGPPKMGIASLLPPGQGMARPASGGGDRVLVDLWGSAAPSKRSLVAVGCDPAAAVVAFHLQGRGVELRWFEQASRSALEQLALGHAHVAGCHLLDEATGTYNGPWARRLLPFPATVVTFAVWHQGLMVAPGNPKQVRGVEDLARPDTFMVNREPGSGSRALLDRALAQAGVPTQALAGYGREAPGHLMVAQVVAMGLADAGVGVKAAAQAAGLDFIPLDQERYDLVIPDHFLDLDPVQELLAALRRPELRRQVESLGGYDTTNMGSPLSAA